MPVVRPPVPHSRSPLPLRMRVLTVSLADQEGGAERIAFRLTAGYRFAGHEATLAVGFKRLDHDWVSPLSRDRNRPSRNPAAPPPAGPDDRKWALRAGMEDFFYPGSWDLLDLADDPPDLVHLHNLHNAYFDLRVLPWLSTRVPVVMTLHDCWLLTGHCAHPMECERWRTGCGMCPDLSIYPPLPRDNTANNWDRKRDLLGASRFFLAAPCDWLRERALGSLPPSSVRAAVTLPNGVDIEAFQPGDRRAARDRFGVPQDAVVALLVSNGGLANLWRDVRTLEEAVRAAAARLAPRRILLLVAGGLEERTRWGSVEVWSFPFLTDGSGLADIYRAADVFVHFARADTFPTVVLEAMACGLPVVATAVGGIPEQIADGETGLLVTPGAVGEAAEALTALLEDEAMRTRLAAAARRRAVAHFDERVMIERYLAWYAKILAGNGEC